MRVRFTVLAVIQASFLFKKNKVFVWLTLIPLLTIFLTSLAAYLYSWNRRKQEVFPVFCLQDSSSTAPDLFIPSFEIRANAEQGETKLRPRPSRIDSQVITKNPFILYNMWGSNSCRLFN
jgi:hypothetical protein